jgi:hypothetical protein
MARLPRIGSDKTKTRIIGARRNETLFYWLTVLEESKRIFPHYFYITEQNNQTLGFLVDITNAKTHRVSSNGFIL